ncbi:MAG TPA: ABC transporter ATP-binding protein [Deltaproteobacteria bacterium]|nr:ABC transporter ATP-binding protein [Deltaproteobacteria bacterium]
MLIVTDLTKSYGTQTLFDSVGFTIGPKERVGLVGRNGSGKTTLFRMIIGEEEPDSGAITVPRGSTVGYVSQHLSFTADTVLREACLGLKRELDGSDTTYKAKAILLGLGFSANDFYRAPSQLSGGYQVRLNLARILVSEPDLLLLDEPTNYLDIVSIRWLSRFLLGWKSQLILVTHDRAFMDSVTTHTMGIYRCKIRKISGTTEKLYQQILQEEEIHEQTRVNEERKVKEIEDFINRFRAQANRAKAVQSRIKTLEKREKLDKVQQERMLDFSFRSAPFQGKWLIETNNLSFRYGHDQEYLLSRFTLAVGRQDRIGIIGKNGKGKTTLLNLFAKELWPTEGRVVPHQNLKIGYFGQTNLDRLNPDFTVEQEIMSADPYSSRGTARNIAGTMLFEGDKALKKISVLSGGEKSRVLLGKLLVSPVNLLLLDEPTNHLDMESVDSLIEAIDAFEGGVLMATHNELVLEAVANRLIVFDGGVVRTFEGGYQDFLERIGWESESVQIESSSTKKQAKRGSERKEIKRLRAEIINRRSKVLSPLQKEIDRIEASIIRLEEQIDDDSEALLRATQCGQGKSIVELSLSIHNSRKSIENLFEELETASTEHHVRSAEFEEELRALEGQAD